MSALLSHRAVLWVSRILLGGVFLYAASSKIFALDAFAMSIKHYQMVPTELIPLFATLLAGVEVSVGLALVAGVWRQGASALVTAMLAMFTVALVTAYAKGLSIECGCFTSDLSFERAGEIRALMLERIIEDIALLLVASNLFVQDWRAARADVTPAPVRA
jgi:uncharacterized membrane protein YphA (DoxX/SURF4 family)